MSYSPPIPPVKAYSPGVKSGCPDLFIISSPISVIHKFPLTCKYSSIIREFNVSGNPEYENID